MSCSLRSYKSRVHNVKMVYEVDVSSDIHCENNNGQATEQKYAWMLEEKPLQYCEKTKLSGQ